MTSISLRILGMTMTVYDVITKEQVMHLQGSEAITICASFIASERVVLETRHSTS